jgi:hypothetical protein
LNYCETTIDLVTEEVEMTFYPLWLGFKNHKEIKLALSKNLHR